MSQAVRDNLIAVGVLLGIVAGTTVLVYLPQRRSLRDLETRIAQQRLRLLENAKKSEAVPEMVRQVQAMKKRYSNFDQRLPQSKELGGFLHEISGNLSQESLSNHLIEPGTPARAKLFHTLPIILRFQGSYLSLASFLKRLEEMERLTQVQKLGITSQLATGRGERPTDALDVEILMNIYFTES